MSTALVHLSRAGVSLVIDTTTGAPTIRHWGAALPLNPHDLTAIASILDRPIPHGGLDVVAPLSVVPEHGSGFLSRPGLEGRRADGSAWAPRFTTTHVDHNDAHATVTVTANDTVAHLQLRVSIELTNAGVARIAATLTNTGDTPYDLDALLLTLPLPGDARELLTASGRWSNEFQWNRQPLDTGVISIENRTGRTSHGRVPVAFAGTRGFSEWNGEVWATHLGWSGNSVMQVEALADHRRRIAAGELLLPGEIVLQPGESYQTPTLYGAYSPAGTNGASHAFHQFLRARSNHPRTPRPASLNTWEAVYFNHDLTTLTALADRAAEVGMERYVLDDGWFQGRRNDRAGLGDWWVDPDVWPNGLTPLIEHVRAHGMEFGIWVEPEMVNPDSDLYRAHPEWALIPAGYEPVLGRHQLVLDVGRPEVRDYLFDHLHALLRDHDITYVKWDMNREIIHGTQGGSDADSPGGASSAGALTGGRSGGRAGVHRQTRGVYELFSRLTAAHPEVEFETCASGGGRADFAILDHTVRIWTSDCQDALERQRIQRGFSYLFPPELLGAHIAAPQSHTTRRTQSLAFRAGTAFFGHFGIEWNLLTMNDDERAALASFVGLYKQHRALLHGGIAFRLDHPNDAVLAHGVVATDRSSAIVSHAQMTTSTSLTMEPLRIPALDATRHYRIDLLPLPGRVVDAARRQPEWTRTPTIASGALLATVGLQPPVLDPESLILIHLLAVD